MTESAITVNFPDNNFFRFQDCQGYRNIQNHFKEMDLCWYHQTEDTLYLIELKNWGDNTLIEENDPSITKEEIIKNKKGISDARINNLFKKSIDSLSMFMCLLLKKPYANNIQNCIPFEISPETKIKFLSIINWTSTDITYISNINTEYKSRFKPYARLYNINTYMVLTKEQASKIFNWIT